MPKGKKLEKTIVKEAIIDMLKHHGAEEDEVLLTTASGQKVVKKVRALVVLDMLYKKAVREKDVIAGREYLDRTSGKPKQAVEHSGEINQADQHRPVTAAAIAAHKAYVATLRAEIAEYEDEEDEDE